MITRLGPRGWPLSTTPPGLLAPSWFPPFSVRAPGGLGLCRSSSWSSGPRSSVRGCQQARDRAWPAGWACTLCRSLGREAVCRPTRPAKSLALPHRPYVAFVWHLCGIRRDSVWGVLCPCESSPCNPRAASPWEGPVLTVGSHLHGGRVGRAAPERSRLLCPRVSLGPGPLGSPAGSGQGAEGVSVQGCRGGVGGGCSGFSFGHLLPTSRGQCPVLGGRVCSGLGPTLSGLLVTCRILTLMHRWP